MIMKLNVGGIILAATASDDDDVDAGHKEEVIFFISFCIPLLPPEASKTVLTKP